MDGNDRQNQAIEFKAAGPARLGHPDSGPECPSGQTTNKHIQLINSINMFFDFAGFFGAWIGHHDL